MQALAYWKAVTTDRAGFLDRVVKLLSESGARYCVIDGQAVNAYAELQLQTDARYAAFVPRASTCEVLGLKVPMAGIEDVLQGKIWAAQDAKRRPSKRQKDLADISRLLEVRPDLRGRVPADLLARLL
jgi:hypothetical protein